MTIPLRINLMEGKRFYQSLSSAPALANRTREQIAMSPRAPWPIEAYGSHPDDTEEVVELLNDVFFRSTA